jgi:DNA-binding Xre family transcriptional regulator
MKTVRNNLLVLMAHKSQREGKRITLRTVERATSISYYTLTKIAHNTIREYPVDVIAGLCTYLDCTIGDLLTLEEVTTPTAN